MAISKRTGRVLIKPQLGETVLYRVVFRTSSTDYPAIITGVNLDGTVDLRVFDPDLTVKLSAVYHAAPNPPNGTWRRRPKAK